MKRKLIRNAWIVNEGKKFRGSLLIDGDIISDIYDAEDSVPHLTGCEIIEAAGKIVFPGLIDDQVHFREPGLTHKGDIASETRAAVAGGITSVMEMPNTIPQTITNELLMRKHEIAAESAVTNYSFYLGATNDNIDEIRRVDPELVCGVKVFMGASTGKMLVDREESLRKIFAESPVLVACHCEDESTIQKNLKSYTAIYGDDIPVKYHPAIRSREACMKSSSLAVSLAVEYGTRLHILHLSTAEEMKLFDNSVTPDKKLITSEVCVHHLWFNEGDYLRLGSLIKWNPAIKSESDRRAIIEAVNNGTIDIIATDHAPHTLEEKNQLYTNAPSGGPLVQHSLQAMLELWHDGVITLEKIVEMMCHNPAIVFGVAGRGFIRRGYKADITIIDPEKEMEVTTENILYKCGWSPFTGFKFRSSVTHTFVNGNLIWCNGNINESFRGESLKFRRR